MNNILENKEINYFIDNINNFAKDINMLNTHLITPSGLSIGNLMNVSTAKDLARLCTYCSFNDIICNIWNKQNKTIQVNNNKNMVIISSINYSYLLDYYPILGAKTGSDGKKYHSFICLTEINGIKIGGSITGALSMDKRFSAIKQLFDIVKLILENKYKNEIVLDANSACAFIIPNTVNEIITLNPIYEQNADIVFPVMSTSKLLTVFYSLNFIDDINKKIYIQESDIIGTIGTSGSIFNGNELISIEDLLYAILLPSSNQATNALARYVGDIILNLKH